MRRMQYEEAGCVAPSVADTHVAGVKHESRMPDGGATVKAEHLHARPGRDSAGMCHLVHAAVRSIYRTYNNVVNFTCGSLQWI